MVLPLSWPMLPTVKRRGCRVSRISAAGVEAVGTLASQWLWCARQLGDHTTGGNARRWLSVALSYFRNQHALWLLRRQLLPQQVTCDGCAVAAMPPLSASLPMTISTLWPAPRARSASSQQPARCAGSHRHHLPKRQSGRPRIDSNGNYVELWSSTIRTWSYVDGSISAVNAASLPPAPNACTRPASDHSQQPQPGRDTWTGFTQQCDHVNRDSPHVDGCPVVVDNRHLPALLLAMNTMLLFPADADGVYVVRTSTGITDTQVAKLSAAQGPCCRQRHCSNSSDCGGPNGLIGIRQ